MLTSLAALCGAKCRILATGGVVLGGRFAVVVFVLLYQVLVIFISN